MYYWRQLEGTATNFASDYVALNYLGVVPYNAATEFIGTAQGFVAKTNATATVTFKNSHRVANSNGQFFSHTATSNPSRMQTVNNSWFNLEGTNETSTILIGFNSNATINFDDDYDGIFIGGTDPLQLYSLVGTEKLLINGQPELLPPNNVDVPLGITTTVAGTYTISIEEEFISTDYFIKLEDTETNTVTDLRLSDYTFSVTTPEEDNTRFIMHYEYDTTLSISDAELETPILKAYFDNDDLHVSTNSNSQPDTIEIYDTNGKILFNGLFKPVTELSNFKSGVYIVKFNYTNFNSISRSIIKQ